LDIGIFGSYHLYEKGFNRKNMLPVVGVNI